MVNTPSYYRVEPYGNSDSFDVTINGVTKTVNAQASDTLDFYFPEGYIDLTSLAMMFKYINIGTLVGTSQALSKDTECLIDRLEVFLGDTQIHDIRNYNQIFYILSMYAFPPEFATQRAIYKNLYTNGRPAIVTTLDGIRFCMDKWLGLLGEDIVLDTKTLGRLHIRLTLGGINVTTSNPITNSWGMTDIYMKAKYYENYDGDLPTKIEFENFKSLKQQKSSMRQRSTFIMNCKQLDYVLARPLYSLHNVKNIAFQNNIGTTYWFVTSGEFLSTWNILINNNPIFKYRPDNQDALSSMGDLFPNGCRNLAVAPTDETGAFNRAWCAGCEVGFVNEAGEQIEITFVTEALGAGITTVCYPLIIGKCTSTIEVKKGGGMEFTL